MEKLHWMGRDWQKMSLLLNGTVCTMPMEKKVSGITPECEGCS